MTTLENEKIHISYMAIGDLKASLYNPRKWSKDQMDQLKESITKYGIIDPVIINSAPGRENILIGGHFRVATAKELGIEMIPVVSLCIPDEEKEKELNLRLNKNTGEFDLKLLAEFDESILSNIGFSSEELDSIFDLEDQTLEIFDLEKELAKLNIENITVQKGDIYDLDGSRLMCGDSNVEEDLLKLMGGEKADMVLTDPPYRLDYLHGKSRNGKPTEGFGAKKNRKYLETDILPDDFTEKWMHNVYLVQKPNFSIIVYENWKNIREIWNTMETYWKVKNMIVWHLPNRNQGYAGKHKFFSKHDIAIVGASKEANVEFNLDDEEDALQEEYETALFAISGKPHWESYGKGKKYCPTDFIDYNAADEKSSGQGIIFGTKPIEILIPYIKVLTKRDDLVIEPFGGSGSTLIACTKMKRNCFIMEKVPTYAEVILNRWEKLTGKKRKKIT